MVFLKRLIRFSNKKSSKVSSETSSISFDKPLLGSEQELILNGSSQKPQEITVTHYEWNNNQIEDREFASQYSLEKDEEKFGRGSNADNYLSHNYDYNSSIDERGFNFGDERTTLDDNELFSFEEINECDDNSSLIYHDFGEAEVLEMYVHDSTPMLEDPDQILIKITVSRVFKML